MSTWRGLGSSLVAGFCLLLGAHGLAQDRIATAFTEEQIVEKYVELAFGSEFDFLGVEVSDEVVAKREGGRDVNIVPIPLPSVSIEYAVSAAERVVQDIEAHSSGLNLRVLNAADVAAVMGRGNDAWLAILPDSVIVQVGSRAELQDELARLPNPTVQKMYLGTFAPGLNTNFPLCLGFGMGQESGPQYIGMALAWVESGPKLEACLYEEIMQSFGIANDFPADTPSIFNDDQRYDRPTQLDWSLWRIHTDPRMKAGMTKAEARLVATDVLAEMREATSAR